MSELTSYNSERIYWSVEQVEREAGDIDDLHLDDNLFYLKSEADKEIAEKDKEIAEQDKEIAELKEQVHDYALGFYVMQARSEKQLRHSNYKRCLAMARWCDEVMLSCELRGYTVHRIWANKHKWAMRWKYRWLELAEKFKEAK